MPGSVFNAGVMGLDTQMGAHTLRRLGEVGGTVTVAQGYKPAHEVADYINANAYDGHPVVRALDSRHLDVLGRGRMTYFEQQPGWSAFPVDVVVDPAERRTDQGRLLTGTLPVVTADEGSKMFVYGLDHHELDDREDRTINAATDFNAAIKLAVDGLLSHGFGVRYVHVSAERDYAVSAVDEPAQLRDILSPTTVMDVDIRGVSRSTSPSTSVELAVSAIYSPSGSKIRSFGEGDVGIAMAGYAAGSTLDDRFQVYQTRTEAEQKQGQALPDQRVPGAFVVGESIQVLSTEQDPDSGTTHAGVQFTMDLGFLTNRVLGQNMALLARQAAIDRMSGM